MLINSCLHKETLKVAIRPYRGSILHHYSFRRLRSRIKVDRINRNSIYTSHIRLRDYNITKKESIKIFRKVCNNAWSLYESKNSERE